MTDVINSRKVTDGSDVRMGVRVTGNPSNGLRGAGSASGSAHARGIPADPDVRQESSPSRVRNFVQLHGGEARQSVTASWPLHDRPSSLADVARRVWPAKGERRRTPVRWAGVVAVAVFRLAVYTVAYLLALAVDTDKRAAVAFAFTLLTAVTVVVSRSLPG